MPALEVKNLKKRFGDSLAVDDVSFCVGERELVCVVGPSGCGKTTVLRCVAGLIASDGGRIAIGGRVAYSASPRVSVKAESRGIGLVFQDYALWPHMSVRQHLQFPMAGRSMTSQQREQQVARLLELVQLSKFAQRRPGELSGGQQQRVALARALAGTPRLLLMDEPMSNLDTRLRQQMRVELVRLVRSSGVATLYVTHDQAEAMSIADRIVVLRNGRVVQQGAPTDVYEQPADLGVADFLGIGPAIAAAPTSESGIVFAGGCLIRIDAFEAAGATRLIVPISAVHAAEQCLARAGEATVSATVESADYEGGSWLVSARLTSTDEALQYRCDRPQVAGAQLALHLVIDRLLPFDNQGLPCPQTTGPVHVSTSSEVTVS